MCRNTSSSGSPLHPHGASVFPQRSTRRHGHCRRVHRVCQFRDSLKAHAGIAPPARRNRAYRQLLERADLWERCTTPPPFSARLGHVVANARRSRICVWIILGGRGAQAVTFTSQLELIKNLHVTSGFRSADVLPLEAGVLVTSFRRGVTDVYGVLLDDVYIRRRIQGRFS